MVWLVILLDTRWVEKEAVLTPANDLVITNLLAEFAGEIFRN